MKKNNVKNEKKEKIIKVLNILSYILSGLFILVLLLGACKSCDNSKTQNTPKQALNNQISDNYIVSDVLFSDSYVAYRFSNEIYSFNEFVTNLDLLINNSGLAYPGGKLTLIDIDINSNGIDDIINAWKYEVDFNTNSLLVYDMPSTPSLYIQYDINVIYDEKWLVAFKDIVFENENINALFEGVYEINTIDYVYDRLDFYFGGGYLFPNSFNFSFDIPGKFTSYGIEVFEFNNITFTYNSGVVVSDIFDNTYAIYERYSNWKRGFYSLTHNGSYIYDVVINQREYNFLKQCTYHLNASYSFRIDNVFQLVSNQNPNVLSNPVSNLDIAFGTQIQYIFDFDFYSGGQTFSDLTYFVTRYQSGAVGSAYEWILNYDYINAMSSNAYPTNYDYNSLRYNGIFTTELQYFDIITKRVTFDFNNLIYNDNDDNNSGTSDKDLYDVFTLVSFTIASFLPFLDYMIFPGLTIGVLIMIPIVITILLFVLSIFKR